MHLARPSHRTQALAPLVDTVEPMGTSRPQDREESDTGSSNPEEVVGEKEPPEEPGRDESQRGKRRPKRLKRGQASHY